MESLPAKRPVSSFILPNSSFPFIAGGFSPVDAASMARFGGVVPRCAPFPAFHRPELADHAPKCSETARELCRAPLPTRGNRGLTQLILDQSTRGVERGSTVCWGWRGRGQGANPLISLPVLVPAEPFLMTGHHPIEKHGEARGGMIKTVGAITPATRLSDGARSLAAGSDLL